METLHRLVDVLLHTNLYLGQLTDQLGPWIYVLLFAVVFCETGLVVTPFLPGDALLFSIGALAATGTSLSLGLVIVTLLLAAWAGDTVNYWIGASFGKRLFRDSNSRLFSHKSLERTHAFYDRHGAKTIILARYVPVIRTFAPFVAGMAAMNYGKFIVYNLAGGALWVLSVTLLGYFFGGLPAVQHNFSLVVLAIIVISMVPPALEFLKAWRGRSRA
jgi:membrane-associated protein